MPGSCTRCRQPKEYGHRDADSQYWYCEDCWLTFCGRRRRCALCKMLRDDGHVDQVVDYWYCMPCWERRPAAGAYGAPQLWPGLYPPYDPYAAGYPFASGYPAVGSRNGSRSRSRERRDSGDSGKKKAKGGSGKKEFKPYHATSLPKVTDLLANEANGPATTAMLRNIPNRLSQNSLLDEIDAEGFSGLYDFFYLPMDVRNKTNVGYAFINFLDPANMTRFSEHFEGYRFKKQNSQKIATVNPAHVQGLSRNVQQLTKKAVLHFNNGEYKPVVFRDGLRVDFEDLAKEYS